jgi:dihydroorotase
MIVIRGGEVLTSRGWERTDLSIEDGTIVEVGHDLSGDVEIDAGGCLVGPGFVDMHSHLREPGQTWKEDIASASAAAIAGGYTAVTAMPNTVPAMDHPEVVGSVLARAEEIGLVDVIASAALTSGRAGTDPSDVESLYRAGVRLFTDDGDCVTDDEVLESVMMKLAGLPGSLVAQHAEDTSLTRDGQMHEGALSRRLGVTGLPAAAESGIVRRDLDLVARTGSRYHCQHVSAKMTVELIRAAKQRDLPVTAEVTPHHLTFDESFLEGLDPNFKMYPPLRSADDRTALVAGLIDGTIDVVATDHAPHLADEKAVGFGPAPRGVIGLETAASATWEVLADRNRFFEVLSTAPATILGLADHGKPVQPGASANLVVFDPEARRTQHEFRSKSSNSPYAGRSLQGEVRATVHRGELVYESVVSVG